MAAEFDLSSFEFNNQKVLAIGPNAVVLAWMAAERGAKKVFIEQHHVMNSEISLIPEIEKLSTNIENYPSCEETKVDIIISQPKFGLDLNMLATYLHAANWLKTGGRIVPSRCYLNIAPFVDEGVYLQKHLYSSYLAECCGLTSKWYHKVAYNHFSLPLIGKFNQEICKFGVEKYSIDFLENCRDSNDINIPFNFEGDGKTAIHGLQIWFEFPDIVQNEDEEVQSSSAASEMSMMCVFVNPVYAGRNIFPIRGKASLKQYNQPFDISVGIYGYQPTTEFFFTYDSHYMQALGCIASTPPQPTRKSIQDAFASLFPLTGPVNKSRHYLFNFAMSKSCALLIGLICLIVFGIPSALLISHVLHNALKEN